MKAGMEKALRNRLTFGPLMLAGLFGLLWLDHQAEIWTAGHGHVAAFGRHFGVCGIGLLILLVIILPPAVVELAQLFAAEKVKPYRFIAATGCGALVVHAFLTQFNWFHDVAASVLAFIIVFTMLFAALRRAWHKETQEAIHAMAGTVLAMLYLGGLGWFLIAIRVKHSIKPYHFQGTTAVILMILLIVKFTDIGAFFGGKATGKHKLIPWLSPGKTWEGLFFGLLTAGIVGMICSHFIHAEEYRMKLWKGLVFGVVIGGIGQLGDLLESMMKRDAEVKDSGSLIPGFGGVLDVIDSPLLAAPFAYLLFSLL
jgi:phosphatidate cytidylyltransferase